MTEPMWLQYRHRHCGNVLGLETGCEYVLVYAGSLRNYKVIKLWMRKELLCEFISSRVVSVHRTRYAHTYTQKEKTGPGPVDC